MKGILPVGQRRHLVILQSLGSPVPDGDGNPVFPVTPLIPPTWFCSIRPASQRELERRTVGTTLTSTSHIVEGDYRPDITTGTQIVFNGRTLYVNSVQNLEERNRALVLLCNEAVPA